MKALVLAKFAALVPQLAVPALTLQPTVITPPLSPVNDLMPLAAAEA